MFICKVCGKNFDREKFRITASEKTGRKILYCSKECRISSMYGDSNMSWRGGAYKYRVRADNNHASAKPFYWNIALEHYVKACNRCLSNNDLQVHHIDRDRSNNHYENLEILCRSCHAKEHNFVENFGKSENRRLSHEPPSGKT